MNSFCIVVFLLIAQIFEIVDCGVVNILDKFDHDPNCFTQGLLYHGGYLYESCGLFKQSSVRKVHPDTGQVIQEHKFSSEIFAEGIAVADDLLYVITWKNKILFVFDISTLTLKTTMHFQSSNGEGWGLTLNAHKHLVLSDGSDKIMSYELPKVPDTLSSEEILKPLREIRVHDADKRTLYYQKINELEYSQDGFVYANIWYEDVILKIDCNTGLAEKFNMDKLYPMNKRTRTADCLNGIAYNSTSDTFLLTGKLWPYYFRVKFLSNMSKDEFRTRTLETVLA